MSSENATDPYLLTYWIRQTALVVCISCFWYGSDYWVRYVVISIGLKIQLVVLSVTVGIILRAFVMYVLVVVYKQGTWGVIVSDIICTMIRYFCMFGIIGYYGWGSYKGVKKD